MLFYFYCIKLRRSSNEFWHAPLYQIYTLIDIYNDEKQMEAAIYSDYEYKSKYFSTNGSGDNQEITSMKEITGWV